MSQLNTRVKTTRPSSITRVPTTLPDSATLQTRALAAVLQRVCSISRGITHGNNNPSLGFDRGWDLEPVTTLSEAVWNPLPRFEEHPVIGSSVPQATKDHDLFGVKHGPHCVPGDPLVGSSFDSLMRGLEHQSYSDVFSYAPAYEPLNWSLPPS